MTHIGPSPDTIASAEEDTKGKSNRHNEKCESGQISRNESDRILCFNKEMLPCKLLFFAENVAFRSLFSFMGLFYQSVGLSVSMIGFSHSIINISSFFMFPIWGAFIDYLQKHRVLFISGLFLCNTAVEFAKPWVIMMIAKTNVESCSNSTFGNISHHRHHTINELQGFHYNGFNISHDYLDSNFICSRDQEYADFTPSYNLHCLHHAGLQSPSDHHHHHQHQRNCTGKAVLMNPNVLFCTITAHNLIASFLFHGVRTFTDSATIKTIYTRVRSYRIGEQKILAPIGAAIGTLLSGVVVDHYHPKHLSPYLGSFYIYLIASLFVLPLLYIITKQANWDYGKEEKTAKKISIWQCLVTACRKCENVMFFVSVFIYGLGISVWNHYLFFYMHHTMNTSKTVMAFTKMIGMATSLIILPLSSKLINFLGGGIRCLTADMFLGALRLLLLSYTTQAWQVLLLEPLFGILPSTIAMTEHIWHIFPKEITTTGIAFLHCFRFAGPNILGNAIGGYLYHVYGGARLFRGAAVLCAGWWVVMFVYFEIICKRNKSVGPVKTVDVEKERNDVEMQ